MSTNISIGFSQHPDPREAVLQACVHVKNQLDSPDTDLVIVFASPQYAIPEVQSIIARTLRPRQLVGSSSGVLILSNGVTDRGITITGINSTEIVFSISAIKEIENQNIHYVGFELARKANQDLRSSHKEVFISFSEGIEKNSSPFIRGMKEVLGGNFPTLGVISSDDYKYKNLSQFFQDQILQHAAVGLLIGGSVHLGVGCVHGFKPLGKPRTITKTEGCIIRTIDDKPAVEIYKHFLGEEANPTNDSIINSTTASYPLGIYSEESDEYLLRNIIDILQDGSIVCHGGVSEGAEVHLMISNSDSCHISAIKAAERVKESLSGNQAKLVLIFESLARHKILGRQAFSEIQAIKKVLGSSVPIIGMGSYGELGPSYNLSSAKDIYLHNSNLLIVAIT